MEGRVVVYVTSQEAIANIVQGHLKAEGIDALILNQRDSSYGTFGSIEIYVKPEDEERAKEIIAKSENE